MVIFVTYREGGYWNQLTEEQFRDQQNCGIKFAAVRVGDWIYDFVLVKLGYSPIRFQPFNLDREGD